MTYCESVWYEQLSVKVQLGYLLVFAHSTRGKTQLILSAVQC